MKYRPVPIGSIKELKVTPRLPRETAQHEDAVGVGAGRQPRLRVGRE